MNDVEAGATADEIDAERYRWLRKYHVDSYLACGKEDALDRAIDIATSAASETPATERDRLRAAQADAVMPLIGSMLDVWECCSQTCREQLPELDRQLRRINRAMEEAGERPNVEVHRPAGSGAAPC